MKIICLESFILIEDDDNDFSPVMGRVCTLQTVARTESSGHLHNVKFSHVCSLASTRLYISLGGQSLAHCTTALTSTNTVNTASTCLSSTPKRTRYVVSLSSDPTSILTSRRPPLWTPPPSSAPRSSRPRRPACQR